MVWFWIPIIIALVYCVVCIIWDEIPPWCAIFGLLIFLPAIPIMVCVDMPNKDRGSTIPPGTCIECKIRVEDRFYAIGCDGQEYKINMSSWALLNVSKCD